MYVCLCKAVTDSQIREAVEEGALHVSHLAERCGLGTGCGRCQDTAQELIDQHLAESLGFAAA
jgi:bacterioferritin-associated ferredoxin